MHVVCNDDDDFSAWVKSLGIVYSQISRSKNKHHFEGKTFNLTVEEDSNQLEEVTTCEIMLQIKLDTCSLKTLRTYSVNYNLPFTFLGRNLFHYLFSFTLHFLSSSLTNVSAFPFQNGVEKKSLFVDVLLRVTLKNFFVVVLSFFYWYT